MYLQLELFAEKSQMSERERKKATQILKDIVKNLKGLEDEFTELKEDRLYFESLLRRMGGKNESD